jgi:hypothetical protein
MTFGLVFQRTGFSAYILMGRRFGSLVLAVIVLDPNGINVHQQFDWLPPYREYREYRENGEVIAALTALEEKTEQLERSCQSVVLTFDYAGASVRRREANRVEY